MSHPFNIPFHGNPKLRFIINQVRKDERLNTLWKCSNMMAIDRLGYSDHGPTHAKIVANLALKLLRILVESNVQSNMIKNYDMKNEDAEVVVVLGSIFHDDRSIQEIEKDFDVINDLLIHIQIINLRPLQWTCLKP